MTYREHISTRRRDLVAEGPLAHRLLHKATQAISANISNEVTSTMGQYWKFFNPSGLQYADPEGMFKLGCIFFDKQPFLVRSTIAKNGLLSLPDEILHNILTHDDLQVFDGVCLAITCKKLLAIAEGGLLKDGRERSCAVWAGKQIVCLGEYTHLEDAPESLIPSALKTDIIERLKAQGCGPEDEYYAGHSYAGLIHVGSEPTFYRGLLDHRKFVDKLPMPDRRLFVAALAVTFPTRDDWVLLNTVKHEYVRAGALAALGGTPDAEQPFLKDSPIDLGMALFTRFCYSYRNDTALPNKSVNIHRGKWVGDRFAIDTIERMKQSYPKREWKDVTDEVVADIEAIYQDEFDEDWEWELTRSQGPCDPWYYQWDDDFELEVLLPSPEMQRFRELREKIRYQKLVTLTAGCDSK
ncbi:hypothetical protein TRAPUB_1771 [Trametes pubescens]|uniref:F-box domain-containing protein n=1 Tax=Trametes pubescens TaxID=154538 RepID=A0A1M2VIF1_TRAPU|nr:hypothetical protein TRAPUB_1771 [Trametes pubescens]